MIVATLRFFQDRLGIHVLSFYSLASRRSRSSIFRPMVEAPWNAVPSFPFLKWSTANSYASRGSGTYFT